MRIAAVAGKTPEANDKRAVAASQSPRWRSPAIARSTTAECVVEAWKQHESNRTNVSTSNINANGNLFGLRNRWLTVRVAVDDPSHAASPTQPIPSPPMNFLVPSLNLDAGVMRFAERSVPNCSTAFSQSSADRFRRSKGSRAGTLLYSEFKRDTSDKLLCLRCPPPPLCPRCQLPVSFESHHTQPRGPVQETCQRHESRIETNALLVATGSSVVIA